MWTFSFQLQVGALFREGEWGGEEDEEGDHVALREEIPWKAVDFWISSSSSVLLLARRSLYNLYKQTCHVTDGSNRSLDFGVQTQSPFLFPWIYICPSFIDNEKGEHQNTLRLPIILTICPITFSAAYQNIATLVSQQLILNQQQTAFYQKKGKSNHL